MVEYKVYWIRWLLLFIEFSTTFTRAYMSNTVAVVNDVISVYFNVSASAVDTLASVDNLSAVPIGILLIAFGGRIGLRYLMVAKSFSTFAGITLCTAGFIWRLYNVILVGRIFMGPAVAIQYILPTILASNWFPYSEWSTAFSIQVFAIKTGAVVASIMFPFLLDSGNSYFSAIYYNTTTIPVIRTDTTFIASFGSFTLFMLLALILTLVYCKDHPPTPPSAAQENILDMMRDSGSYSLLTVISETWREIKKLLSIPQFVLLTISTLFKRTFVFAVILMPSFMLLTFPELDSRTPGLILVVSMIVSALISPVTGRILDKFKTFKFVTVLSHIALISCIVAAFFGHRYKNLPTLYIAYPLSQLTSTINFIAFAELLIETTYPGNKMIIMSIYCTLMNLSTFIFIALVRKIQEIFDESWGVFSMIPMNVLSVMLVIFAKPEYKRTNVDQRARSNDVQHEETENLIAK